MMLIIRRVIVVVCEVLLFSQRIKVEYHVKNVTSAWVSGDDTVNNSFLLLTLFCLYMLT